MLNSQFPEGYMRENRRVDFLAIRLRRMIRAVLQDEKQVGYLSKLNERYKFAFYKVLWAMLFLLSMTMFLYQTCDRLQYYMRSPVATNVLIKKRSHQTMPEFTICYQETEGSLQLFEQFPTRPCESNLVYSMLGQPGLSVEELWQKVNTTPSIISAKEIGDETIDLAYSSVAMVFGTCTTFWSKNRTPLPTNKGRFEIIFKMFKQRCVGKSVTHEGIQRNWRTFYHTVKNPTGPNQYDKQRKYDQFTHFAIRTKVHDLFRLNEIPTVEKVYFHEPDDYPHSFRDRSQNAGGRYRIGISVRQFSFLNRTLAPCISHSDYSKCFQKCFARFSAHHGKCRFPFQPEMEGVPKCGSIFENSKLWNILISYLTGNSPKVQNCNCDRKCSLRIFQSQEIRTDAYKNQSVIEVSFDDPHETMITEESIYELAKLFIDMGGNSGLWIGTSILSLFELFQPLIDATKKKKRPQFHKNDPLFSKVLKTYYGMNKITDDKTVSRRSALKYAVLACCTCVFVLAAVSRTSLYFSNPMRRVVEIAFNDSFEVPSLTICPGDRRVIDLQAQYAKLNNIIDYCDVPLWDLLSLPGINATYIWKNLEIDKDVEFWGVHKPVSTYEGTCVDLDNGKSTMTAVHESWHKSDLGHLCGQKYQKVYVKPPIGHYDYFLYRYLIDSHIHQFMYIIKEIEIDDEKEVTCVSEKEHVECKMKCRNKKLLNRIHCRLPYMVDVNMNMCVTSKEAKHSQLTYIELFVLPGGDEDCDCYPACIQRFYTTLLVADTHGYLSINFGASHNVVETYMTRTAYPLVALLCDLGGWLGSTLGLCVFSSMEGVLFKISKRFTTKNEPLKSIVVY